MHTGYLGDVSGEDGNNTSHKIELVQKFLSHQLKSECIIIVHSLSSGQLCECVCVCTCACARVCVSVLECVSV